MLVLPRTTNYHLPTTTHQTTSLLKTFPTNTHQSYTESKNPWLVFYTKSRQEKKVKEILEKRGFSVFLPTQKVLRQWSDRKKRIEVPLFNSYIFVSLQEYQINEVLEVPGVSWIIRNEGKPAELHPKEYDTIVRFMETGLLIDIQAIENLEVGEEVEIMDGPLKKQRGFISGTGKDKFTVLLDALGQAIRVEISGLILRKVK